MEKVDGLWTIYLVWWPELGVAKVGRTQRTVSRHRDNRTGLPDRVWSLVTALLDGVHVLRVEQPVMVRDMLADAETDILGALRERFLPAFGTEAEGARLLPGGRGFTECFRVESAEEYELALRMFHEGIAFHADKSAAVAAAVRFQRAGDCQPASRSAADGYRSARVRGRLGSMRGAASSNACRALRARRDGHDPGFRGAFADLGRRRMAASLYGRPGEEPTASQSVATCAAPGSSRVGFRAATGLHEAFTRLSGDFHGKGEGARERGRGRGRGCAGAPFTRLSRTATPTTARAFPVLLGASAVGHRESLRALRDGPDSSRYLRSGGSRCGPPDPGDPAQRRPGRRPVRRRNLLIGAMDG